jgi:MarR family transcriptional regulator, negative regulator of the multidrug operon emrRAB
MTHSYESTPMLSHRSANLVAALGTALADAQAQACESLGIHPSDAAALITLGYHPRATVSALAPIIGFTPSAAVRLVERLATNRLVRRERGRDRREVMLSLTARGVALRTRLLDARRAVIEKATGPLQPKQMEQLEAIVEVMLAALTDGREAADHICRLCDENACPPETCPVERKAVRAKPGLRR